MPTDPMALAGLLDPSLYLPQLQAQQSQQLAQALMTQGITPMGGTQSVGGVAIRTSPMEGAAKLAALLSGQSLQGQANDKTAALMAQQAMAMRGAFGMGAPQGGAYPASGQAPSPMPGGPPPMMGGQSQGGPMTIAGMSPGQAMLSYGSDPGKYMESFNKQFDPTDMQRMMRAAGIDPNSPLGQQIAQGAIAKANNVPLEEVKAGNTALDPFTKQPRFYAPRVPEGATPVFGGPGGNVSSIGMVPGATDSITAAKGAEQANDIIDVPLPNGQTQKMTRPQFLAMVGGGSTPYNFTGIAPEKVGEFRDTLVRNKDWATLAALDGKMPGVTAGQTTAGQAAATKAGALPQEDLDKRFGELKVANAQAETTNSYLQNIKTLAAKAATGQFSDKQVLLNSMLDAAGVSERATDATTANNLLEKYSKQIVARLGQGSLGTDAARDLLQAAYPNSKMTRAAIEDAADNLIGANQMIQAKTRLLSPHGNTRDPVKYQEQEQVFDQNADPRIWQYANIQDPGKRKAFLQGILKTDPRFLERAQKLHEIGAL